MNQLALPTEVTPTDIWRERTLGGAIALCAKAGGFEPKQVMDEIRTASGKPVDKAQWSRWVNDGEGIEWPKLTQLMDVCGNDAPLLWMVHARGYDLHAMRRRETELEQENRLLREERDALRRVLQGRAA